MLGHRAARVEPAASGVRVVARADDGRERAVEGRHLLVAAGRRPNTDALGLEVVGVATDERGFVWVDERLATTATGVWVIGCLR